ncbi:putative dehydrogenase [Salipiger mucosus DSM 16094]|uniref:Putative dehydrogenase n=1 Tax=Salipiger mucosus DSM 16094 TaxID=1123237 RepID=S9R0K3_9RHOB|nr:putative dehydrogenase [Salipiger mucosus DSM 16094]
MGCPRHARASADIAYLAAAQARGVEVRSGAVATGLKRTGGRVTGLRYTDAQGAQEIDAAEVVLAGNALGTARLMEGVEAPPLFGRGLMMHPTAIVTGLFADNIQSYRGAFAAALVSQQFYETDIARGFTRGFQMQALRGQGPLTTALGGYGLALPWGKAHAESFAASFGRSLSLTVTCDDIAEDRNRIALHPTRRDAHGLAVPRMIYRVGENSRRLLDFGIKRASEALREAGAGALRVNPLSRNAGFHLMGTARMGRDAETSVTDAFGRVHGVPGLSIVDASTFVTAAPVNPTPTLQAIALRAGEAMRGHLNARTETTA